MRIQLSGIRLERVPACTHYFFLVGGAGRALAKEGQPEGGMVFAGELPQGRAALHETIKCV